MCKILVTLYRLGGGEDLCKRMTGENFVFLNFLENFDGAIDRPRVDYTGVPDLCISYCKYMFCIASLFFSWMLILKVTARMLR